MNLTSRILAVALVAGLAACDNRGGAALDTEQKQFGYAIGVDIDGLPLTPDRVMDALVERRRQQRLANARRIAS